MADDERLYFQYLKGDERAAEELVARYGNALTIYIDGFIGDLQEAEDLMIEAFSLIFAKARPVTQPGSFKGYLFKIARNLAARRKKRRHLLLSLEEINFDPKSEVLAESGLMLEERKARLYKAMEDLKDDYREALYLIYFEDMSYRQAATVLDKTESQVSKLVYRGKQNLKTALEKEGFVYEDK